MTRSRAVRRESVLRFRRSWTRAVARYGRRAILQGCDPNATGRHGNLGCRLFASATDA